MTYYQSHKDIILTRSKQYYYKNKDKINDRLNKIKCIECGGYYKNFERHQRSKSHWQKIFNFPIFNEYKNI